MERKIRRLFLITLLIPLLSAWIPAKGHGNTSAPTTPVKLIFIHHSTGGNWLADPNEDGPHGGLGRALMENNYFVSATNYGWGPDSIGDRTDIINWPEWFTGPNSTTIMNAVYGETGKNIDVYGDWPRLANDPGGENSIILFKSCFPNSDLYGDPDDPPAEEINTQYTVANAKAIYNNLLTYFQSRQDKLFVVITAPPKLEVDFGEDDPWGTVEERAANGRAFHNWLVSQWLSSYHHNNVAVFDYYNVLTGVDNHHRWYNNTVQHVNNSHSNFPAPGYTDGPYNSHPSTTAHTKATGEFVPLLNYFYNTWQASGPAPGPDPEPDPDPSPGSNTAITHWLMLLLSNT